MKMHLHIIRFGVVEGDTLITREAAEKAVEKLKARGTIKVQGIERTVRDVSIEYDAEDESKGRVTVFLYTTYATPQAQPATERQFMASTTYEEAQETPGWAWGSDEGTEQG